MACNVNCLVETVGLFKVTRSRLRGKSGNVLETVQDRDIVSYYRPLIGSDVGSVINSDDLE